MWSSGVALNLIGTKLGKASIIENSAFWMTGESVFMILAGVSLFWIFLLLPERESDHIGVRPHEIPSDLSEQECKALIEVLELRNRLSDMQQEAIYFRGCYDSVGYLKKAGIL